MSSTPALMSPPTSFSRSGADGAAVEPDPLPVEPLRGGIPRKQDQDLERDRQAAGRRSAPRTFVRAGQRRDFEDALRPDDDLRQGEPVVRKRTEQLRVERAGADVALPALAGRDELVGTVRRER